MSQWELAHTLVRKGTRGCCCPAGVEHAQVARLIQEGQSPLSSSTGYVPLHVAGAKRSVPQGDMARSRKFLSDCF